MRVTESKDSQNFTPRCNQPRPTTLRDFLSTAKHLTYIRIVSTDEFDPSFVTVSIISVIYTNKLQWIMQKIRTHLADCNLEIHCIIVRPISSHFCNISPTSRYPTIG